MKTVVIAASALVLGVSPLQLEQAQAHWCGHRLAPSASAGVVIGGIQESYAYRSSYEPRPARHAGFSYDALYVYDPYSSPPVRRVRQANRVRQIAYYPP